MFIKELHNLVGALVEKEKAKLHKTLQEENELELKERWKETRELQAQYNKGNAAPPPPVRNDKEIENLQTEITHLQSLLKNSNTDLVEQQQRVKTFTDNEERRQKEFIHRPAPAPRPARLLQQGKDRRRRAESKGKSGSKGKMQKAREKATDSLRRLFHLVSG